jgi:hypothetical protein
MDIIRVRKGEVSPLEVIAIDENGNNVTGLTVSYSITRLSDGSSVDSGTLTEVGNGVYKESKTLGVGQYRVEYTATDYVKDVDIVIVYRPILAGGGVSTWSEKEKEKVLEDINNIKSSIKTLIGSDTVDKLIKSINDRLLELNLSIKNLTEKLKNIKASEEFIDDLNRIKIISAEIKKTQDLQSKLLLAQSDIVALAGTIDEVESYGTKGNSSRIQKEGKTTN